MIWRPLRYVLISLRRKPVLESWASFAFQAHLLRSLMGIPRIAAYSSMCSLTVTFFHNASCWKIEMEEQFEAFDSSQRSKGSTCNTQSAPFASRKSTNLRTIAQQLERIALIVCHIVTANFYLSLRRSLFTCDDFHCCTFTSSIVAWKLTPVRSLILEKRLINSPKRPRTSPESTENDRHFTATLFLGSSCSQQFDAQKLSCCLNSFRRFCKRFNGSNAF